MHVDRRCGRQTGWVVSTVACLGADTLGGRTVVEGTDVFSMDAFMSMLLLLISYEPKLKRID